jgi:quercetin dioxygenase-like cupin family protein
MRTPGRTFVLFVLIGACAYLALVMPDAAIAQPPIDPNTDSAGNPLPGSSIPCAPLAQKRQELGCYVVARQPLGALPHESPLAWHLDAFASRAQAEAARGTHSIVAEVFDRVWLLTIAAPDWRPTPSAQHVATVGPLTLDNAVAKYAAFYVASTFRPGFYSFAHAHPGPEAWFILTGEQCLETPEGRILGRAGEGMVVHGDLPMIVRSTGTEIRRNFALVLHDAAKPVTTRVDDWKPAGLCAN